MSPARCSRGPRPEDWDTPSLPRWRPALSDGGVYGVGNRRILFGLGPETRSMTMLTVLGT
ncbi:uncharacterized protein N7483_004736 [Penicillium malachiteum]|uniref:uncharacterized protein n=1 Tax=Penicillium malachiteum TaxID=1324776 RepID=UPI00254906E8|nr:uncharacterized protein N7483_004736 [Penicillium malachiteum]KAJ5730228.1 hypothetical protein N7483_004736 [Penicillium malachiteum]